MVGLCAVCQMTYRDLRWQGSLKVDEGRSEFDTVMMQSTDVDATSKPAKLVRLLQNIAVFTPPGGARPGYYVWGGA